MLTPEMIANKFGPEWCHPGLFNEYPHALRFKLSMGGHGIDQFLSAHKRALAVVQDAFCHAEDLHLAVKIYIDSKAPGVISLLECFRGLRDCGLPLPHRDAIKTSQASYDEEVWYSIMVMPLRVTELARALWPPLGSDHRIEPRLSADVYILSPELGILVHPYDDRGMDIIGPNRAKLKEVYVRHRSWLLPDCLEAMDRSFGKPDSVDGGGCS